MEKKDYIKMVEDAFLTLEKGEVYRHVIGVAEKALIEKALERSYGNQIIAAKILGINRNTLRTKIRRLHIDVGSFKC